MLSVRSKARVLNYSAPVENLAIVLCRLTEPFLAR